MAFHNELSGDIAIALLTQGERSEAELNTLKETILSVHQTLRELANEAGPQSSTDLQANSEKAFVAT